MIHNSWVKNKNKNQYIVHFKRLCRGAVYTYYRVAFNCCCKDIEMGKIGYNASEDKS